MTQRETERDEMVPRICIGWIANPFVFECVVSTWQMAVQGYKIAFFSCQGFGRLLCVAACICLWKKIIMCIHWQAISEWHFLFVNCIRKFLFIQWEFSKININIVAERIINCFIYLPNSWRKAFKKIHMLSWMWPIWNSRMAQCKPIGTMGIQQCVY